jgi:hypothetical protein
MTTTLPIHFSDPDDPQAREALREAFTAESVPQAGLIFKVRIDPDGSERLVNWQVADAQLVQAVILGMTLSAASPP